jgi:hypothetical protein
MERIKKTSLLSIAKSIATLQLLAIEILHYIGVCFEGIIQTKHGKAVAKHHYLTSIKTETEALNY